MSTQHRRISFYLGWAAFAAFAIIVGVVRLTTMRPDEGTWTQELPMALLMIALTIVPPLVLEHLLRTTMPVVQLAREQHHLGGELKFKTRDYQRLQVRLTNDRKALHDYEERAAKFRAEYDAEFYNNPDKRNDNGTH